MVVNDLGGTIDGRGATPGIRFAPEKVPPAVARLCSDAAVDVTGRQLAISGDRVSLLFPAAHWIEDRSGGVWTPAEIGARIRKSMDD